nr:M50 family metallopeptidase [uncultured Actinoplanes sp.]
MADVGMAWTTGVVAFVAAGPLWRYTTHAITVAHEGGHALFGVLFGRGITYIKVMRGGNGATGFSGGGWFAVFFSFLAGYLGPSIFGLAGAWMLVHDIAPRAVLLTSLALVAILLLMVRNLFGFVAVPMTGAILWALAMRADAAQQMVAAHIWVWFLLMGGVRQIPELYKEWADRGEPDTDVLAGQTGLSTAFFVALFWAGSLAALIYGGVLLLRHGT